MTYVAPVHRHFIYAHIRDDDRPAEPGKADDGWTRCGEPMATDELWLEIKAEHADPVCPGCKSPGPAIETPSLW